MGKRIEEFCFRLYPAIEMWDELSDGVSILDTRFSVVDANKTMRDWYAQESFPLGEKCYRLYHKRGRPCPWCPTRTTMERGKAASGIVPYHNREGKQEGWQKLVVFPVFDEDRHLVGVMEYVQNVTGKKWWEEKIGHYEAKIEVLEREIALLKYLLEERRKEEKIRKRRWSVLVQEIIRPTLERLEGGLRGKPERECLQVIEMFLFSKEDYGERVPYDLSLFTPREMEIARLILEGKTTKEIAYELSLSPKAVEFHRQNLREKLGIRHKKVSLQSSLFALFRY